MDKYTEQIYPELDNGQGQLELDQQFSFASRWQLFAVVVYLLSHIFTIPILAFGPSWAVWPRLDDFAALFLFIVYLGTRNNMCPMDKNERTVFILIAVGVICMIPSFLLGSLLNPGAAKGMIFGIAHTYRVAEYSLVWLCIRGMTFSSKQFDKMAYVVFFVVIFAVIICIGNITGAIPPSRLTSHLPQGLVAGRYYVFFQRRIGASIATGPYAGSLVIRMTLLTMFLLASKKPPAVFRIPLIVMVGGVIFFSEARTGMISWALAIAIFSCKSIKQLAIIVLMIFLVFILATTFSGIVDVDIMEKAKSDIASVVDDAGANVKLSGRIERWSMIFQYIASHPHVLMLGVGWGFAGQIFDGNAHNMYLQILCELGLLGLFVFCLLLFKMWILLRGKDRLLGAMRAAFLVYLISGLTGEVFYPEAANDSFLGCLCAIFAIAVATYRGKLLEEQYNEMSEFAEEYTY